MEIKSGKNYLLTQFFCVKKIAFRVEPIYKIRSFNSFY